MINDVSRAFFEAPAVRQVCAEIPDDDLTAADRRADNVGHLKMSLYGARDAAMTWQEEVAREMRKWGLKRGRSNPCFSWGDNGDIFTTVHGDDFVSVGSRQATQELKKQLQERFEIKLKRLGLDLGYVVFA